jgi:hypothetical protein
MNVTHSEPGSAGERVLQERCGSTSLKGVNIRPTALTCGFALTDAGVDIPATWHFR